MEYVATAAFLLSVVAGSFAAVIFGGYGIARLIASAYELGCKQHLIMSFLMSRRMVTERRQLCARCRLLVGTRALRRSFLQISSPTAGVPVTART
jgi:hypothetical protein